MTEFELIGVPFDGYGRPGNQARASTALREAGLAGALGRHAVRDGGDLDLPAGTAERGRETTLINEPALLAMTVVLGRRVADGVARNRFPLVYGGDCTTLLGSVPALRELRGDTGLLFVDGHEDTMPLDVSEDGEAANTEIGLLLGLTGKLLRGPLAERLPALPPAALAVLGPRDSEWRRRFNVGSLRDSGVWLRDCDEVVADPAAAARTAVGHVTGSADGWWLHVDLDVLDPTVFPAQGLPDVEDEPGGLTWEQLTDLLTTAIGAGGCLGWSMAIYDPDQDPARDGARRIVELVADVAAALTG